MKLNTQTKHILQVGDGLRNYNEVLKVVNMWHCGKATYITLIDTFNRHIYGCRISLWYGTEIIKNIEKPYKINEQ